MKNELRLKLMIVTVCMCLLLVACGKKETWDSIVQDYDVSDEIKHADELTENKWQVFDNIFIGGQTTFAEIREKMIHALDDYPIEEVREEFNQSYVLEGGGFAQTIDDECYSEQNNLTITYDYVLKNNGVQSVSIHLSKNPKVDKKGFEYINDYLFVCATALEGAEIDNVLWSPMKYYLKPDEGPAKITGDELKSLLESEGATFKRIDEMLNFGEIGGYTGSGKTVLKEVYNNGNTIQYEISIKQGYNEYTYRIPVNQMTGELETKQTRCYCMGL